MAVTKPFLRGTTSISLLKKKNEHSLTMISDHSVKFFMKTSDYGFRSLSKVNDGKAEFQRLLADARNAFFTREDMINWLYKIKEDAKNESDNVFMPYLGSIGMKEEDIDFERVGFLTGIFEEAERYLNLIIAIEPIDANKPHYSILDSLEELDEKYIRTDNIPGYYAIQKDPKILKQEYELKNLQDFWSEYISLKDKHKVGEGFGNKAYLLSQYHSEFRWEFNKIRPREKLKEFLSFHYKNYGGDPINFLNHIEFRIMPEIASAVHSDYHIYKQLMQEWLHEQRNQLNPEKEIYLLDSVIAVSSSFVDNITEYRKSEDENKYNTFLCALLNNRLSSKSWPVKDQSLGGDSNSHSKAKRAGIAFRDMIICDEFNRHISSIECFRLKYVPSQDDANSIISDHLIKIFRNEPLGLSPLFVIVYCETKSFIQTWEKYVNHIKKIDFNGYRLLSADVDLVRNTQFANIQIAKATHQREGNKIDVYHIFINMFP